MGHGGQYYAYPAMMPNVLGSPGGVLYNTSVSGMGCNMDSMQKDEWCAPLVAVAVPVHAPLAAALAAALAAHADARVAARAWRRFACRTAWTASPLATGWH